MTIFTTEVNKCSYIKLFSTNAVSFYMYAGNYVRLVIWYGVYVVYNTHTHTHMYILHEHNYSQVSIVCNYFLLSNYCSCFQITLVATVLHCHYIHLKCFWRGEMPYPHAQMYNMHMYVHTIQIHVHVHTHVHVHVHTDITCYH